MQSLVCMCQAGERQLNDRIGNGIWINPHVSSAVISKGDTKLTAGVLLEYAEVASKVIPSCMEAVRRSLRKAIISCAEHELNDAILDRWKMEAFC